MNDFEDDATRDDLEVEITELEPLVNVSRISRVLRTLESRPSLRSRTWRIATAGSALMLILLVISGTFPAAHNLALSFITQLFRIHTALSPAAKVTPSVSYVFNSKEIVVWSADTSSTVTPSATLGPIPQDCPQDTQTQPFDFHALPAVGNSPVWVIGFEGPIATFTHLKRAQRPESGWYQPIALITETNYAGTVTLRGGEVNSGIPIWFGMRPHNQGPITTFTVQPMDSSLSNRFGDDQQWGSLPAKLYIPRAGCYFLTATWAEGGWIVFFAAGR